MPAYYLRAWITHTRETAEFKVSPRGPVQPNLYDLSSYYDQCGATSNRPKNNEPAAKQLFLSKGMVNLWELVKKQNDLQIG
jgi:hypothetical protein